MSLYYLASNPYQRGDSPIIAPKRSGTAPKIAWRIRANRRRLFRHVLNSMRRTSTPALVENASIKEPIVSGEYPISRDNLRIARLSAKITARSPSRGNRRRSSSLLHTNSLPALETSFNSLSRSPEGFCDKIKRWSRLAIDNVLRIWSALSSAFGPPRES
jgi:hypothetical protein